mmetsp:Transcript_24540/g.24781  ORF Transcript_24540/g.24781 Transcript_24540/m.24781 type:complete len:448 (-) Transcript_24540:94-1437(-)|eukprot:CAMPEP_0182434380 /NCGR_PEP_ID=MMETSP1167-20130531/69475_1 /TAXON_ID=2988 /ORGANISM="Mallomonas Sp, Strain CCMP3275" /LENGTH=447 /DNA_ID=CAMNT_0024624199 /DNA_START=182 /DNA_END=1525 /DNA_ORIENTATION=+
MQISCSYGRSIYRAGGLVIVLVKSPNPDSHNAISRDAVILTQAHGHINFDSRWISTTGNVGNILLQMTQYTTEQKVQLPRHFGNNGSSASLCTFITPREVIQLSHLHEDGVYLQFELPYDTLPTFRGLGITISYFITISIQMPNGTNHIHLPFKVCGRGDMSAPQYIRYSALSTYPASSLPPESVLLPVIETEDASLACTDDDNELNTHLHPACGLYKSGASPFTKNQSPKCVYAIRDDTDALVCNLSLRDCSDSEGGITRRDLLTPRPGQALLVTLNFKHAWGAALAAETGGKSRRGSRCQAVQARLMQKELRLDGSRIQEKVMDSSTRSTSGAVAVLLRLQIPDNSPNSFVCPLVQVSYEIVLEFYLGDEDCSGGGSSTKSGTAPPAKLPFSWVLPVDIYPAGVVARWPRCEAVACLEPVAVWDSSSIVSLATVPSSIAASSRVH